MKKNIILASLAIIIVIFVIIVVANFDSFLTIQNESNELVRINEFFQQEFLFDVYLPLNEVIAEDGSYIMKASSGYIKPISENEVIYKDLAPRKDSKSIVIIPMFTAMAYSEDGFYDYYNGLCDESCLTVKIKNDLELTHNSSNFGAQVLRLLGYEWITDLKVHNNPEILLDYDRVILLHNEYVTREMFDVITSHPNVVYLYPNALYAEIALDYQNESIKLIRGHNYPRSDILNGFDWQYDNTHPYEYDTSCNEWEFYAIDNGHMLNCYPENAIFQSKELLKTIRELGLE